MNPLTPPMKYLWLTCRHKAFVFRSGLRTKTNWWDLVIHDWSKFTPSELPHYGRQFFGDKSDPDGFARAWLHHQNLNPHHWEYWIPRTHHIRDTSGSSEPLPMPIRYVREMVADWLGASRAYSGSWPESYAAWAWFHEAYPKMILHGTTRGRIGAVLAEVFPEEKAKCLGIPA